MRDDAALGRDEAAVSLVDDVHLLREPVPREPASDVGAGQDLVLEIVLFAGAEHAVEDLLSALHDPGDVDELLS